MTKPTANLRLFVAVYPPMESRHAMTRLLERLALPPHRATRPDQVHLTLQFVGDVPARELDHVLESARRSAAGVRPFTLRPRRMVSLPESARPRLVALETDSPPPLLELHRRLAHRLARTARERPGDRFRPHLTLCRFAPGSRPEPVDATADLEAFPVAELLVMRSTLRPQGAEHSAVERVALG